MDLLGCPDYLRLDLDILDNNNMVSHRNPLDYLDNYYIPKAYDFRNHNKFSKKRPIYIVQCILFPIIMGACIEIAQDRWFYPRTAEWVDWLADILGVGMALVISHFYKRTIQSR